MGQTPFGRVDDFIGTFGTRSCGAYEGRRRADARCQDLKTFSEKMSGGLEVWNIMGNQWVFIVP